MKEIWIFSGGGTRCAWTSGVLYEFGLRQVQKPDILITASGSVGAGLYYTSGQIDHIHELWMNIIPNNNLFIQKGLIFPKINTDYIANEVLAGSLRPDTYALLQSKTELVIPALDSLGACIEYFSLREYSPRDWSAICLATMSVPFLTECQVSIGGKKYNDSILSSSPYLHLHSMRTKYPEAKIKVVSITRDWSIIHFEDWLYRFRDSQMLQHFEEGASLLLAEATKQYRNEEILTPSRKYGGSMFNNSKQYIHRLFELGQHDARKWIKEGIFS